MGDESRAADARRWRIEALRRFPGEPLEAVLERRFEPVARRDAAAPVREDEHRWMERVVGTVRRVHPEFLVVADAAPLGGHAARIQLLDDDASVSLTVEPDHVLVIPLPDDRMEGAAGFALMWRVCQALARDADCVIVDPARIAVIEMELDTERAREEYGWI